VPLLTIDAAERVVIVMDDSYSKERVWINSSTIYILEHGMITTNHASTTLDDSISISAPRPITQCKKGA
jgi:hypothetical protein